MKNKSSNNQKAFFSFQLYPLGDSAIVLQFENSISPETHEKISAFAACIEENPFPGLIEFVPAFTTLTIYYDPWILSEKGRQDPYERVGALVQELASKISMFRERNVRIVEVPVCYGGEFGPDLEFVAGYNAISPDEVIAIHAGQDYLVYMIGFAPGFPYLGGMDGKIATPRKANPRPAIPAGSVGIAGMQTGIYPLTTPGGWQLIGRTPMKLFDPLRKPPALLKAGDKVRFVPISPEDYQAGREGENEP